MPRHAREESVPIEALLADDPELWMVWAPLPPENFFGGCDYDACCCNEHCTCQEGEPEE